MLGTARAAALYLALAVLLLAPLSLHPASRAPDDGDALYSVWITAWSAHHLSLGYPGLLEANAFYPHPSGLVYSEPLLAQALLGWPLFQLFSDALVASNLLLVLILALSALAMHLLLREFSGSDAAACCGAVVYVFNAYTFTQLPRLQLVTLQWMPLAFLFLFRFLKHRRFRDAALFGLCGVLQGMSCLYYLVFYLTALAVIVPLALWQTRALRSARVLGGLAVVGLACGALLGAFTQPFRALFRRYEFVGEPGAFDLAGFLQPPWASALYGSLVSAHPVPEHFLGVLALAVAGVGLRALWRSGRRAPAWGPVLAGALAAVLAAGPVVIVFGRRLGRGPLQYLYDLPPFDQLRDPDRFVVLVYLGLAVLVALGASRLLEGRHPAWAALLVALLLAEHTRPGGLPGREVPSVARAPEAYRWLAARPDRASPVAELPVRPFRQVRWANIDAYLSTAYWNPILMARPSLYPPALEWIHWSLRDFPDERSLVMLRGLGFRYALVHPDRWPDDARWLMSRRLERLGPAAPRLWGSDAPVDEVAALYKMGGERIHALPALDAVPEPRACACREIPRGELRVEAAGAAGWAVDGRRDTKWSTREGQHEGHQFDVVFDRPRRPVRVEVEMAFPWGEFPRNLEVNGYLGGKGFRVRQQPDPAYDLALARQLVADPSRARLRYDLEPAEMERLRLFIHRTEEATLPWSIAEIHVFEAE